MNVKFLIRGLLLAIPMAVLISAGWIFLQTPFARPADPTPPPPTILAPQGTMPVGSVGLEEWAQYQDQTFRRVASGFFFSLASGEIVGATTSHSVSLDNASPPLERIGLRIAGHAEFVAELDTLRGQPGHRSIPEDLVSDYLLLNVSVPIESSLVLSPDPRGAPQPGERVSLYSGLGDGRGGRRVLDGTVQSVDEKAVWILMDKWFNPGSMSGSPFVSQHTGQAVGMVVVGSPRLGRLLIGAHPIGSLVNLAESATEFPKLRQLGQTSERTIDPPAWLRERVDSQSWMCYSETRNPQS